MSNTESEVEIIDQIEEKIVEIMTVYPRLSPTMLQAGLGPSLPPKIWRPALDSLVAQGVIKKTSEFPNAASTRTRPFTILELMKRDAAEIKVPPPPRAQTVNVDSKNIAIPALA